jgi:hypothetical protein
MRIILIGGVIVWLLLILFICRWFYVISERREREGKSDREVRW